MHQEVQARDQGMSDSHHSEGDEQQKSQTPTLSTDEFLARFCSQASQLVRNAYITERSLRESNNDKSLTLSLCDDICYLLKVQAQVLDDYLASTPLDGTAGGEDVRTEALFSILHALFCRQLYYRNSFLTDFETCCAAANDFMSLMEGVEEWAANISELIETVPDSNAKHEGSCRRQHREVSDLLQLYSRDAVYSVQVAQVFAFRILEESGFETDLFGIEWEEQLTQNEVVRSLVNTMADYVADLDGFLCFDLLRKKAMDALVRVAVIFYIQCLAHKAYQVRLRRKEKGYKFQVASQKAKAELEGYCRPFSHPPRAIQRIKGDVFLLKSFFKSWVLQMPALDRVIEEEHAVLGAVCDCLEDAAGVSEHNMSSFLTVIHKGTHSKCDVTKRFASDLIILVVSNKDLCKVLIESMEKELVKVESSTQTEHKMLHNDQFQRYQVPDLQLDVMLAQEYKTDCHMQPEPYCNSSTKTFSTESLKSRLKSSRKKIPKKLHKLSAQVEKAKPKQAAKNFMKTCERAGNLKQQHA